MSAKKSSGQQGQFLPLAPGRGYFFCNISFEFTLPQVCYKDTQSMARTQLIYPWTEAAKGKYQVNQSWSFIHCRRGLSLWTAWLLIWKYQNAITLVTSRTSYPEWMLLFKANKYYVLSPWHPLLDQAKPWMTLLLFWAGVWQWDHSAYVTTAVKMQTKFGWVLFD